MRVPNHTLNIALLALACSVPHTPLSAQPETPETVHRLTKVQKSGQWYRRQADLWKQEIEKDPKNAEAWYNYYWANRYVTFSEDASEDTQTRLDRILSDMGKAIPNTFEYLYLSARDKDIVSLEKAYRLRPDHPGILEALFLYYELKGETEKAGTFAQKWYRTRDIASGWLEHNYNVLMSTKKNAILFTNGDNDTYPAWILQQVKGIRQDVTVLNVFLSRKEPYCRRLLKEKTVAIDWEQLPDPHSENWIPELCRAISRNNPNRPIYFAITVHSKYYGALRDDLYLIGLAYQYSIERIDNLALLKKNLERNLRLDYLKYDWYSETHISTEPEFKRKHNLNYIVVFMMLYEHYKTAGEHGKAEYWKDFATEIAKRGKSQHRLKYIRERI